MRFTLTALLGAALVAAASAQPPEPKPIPLPLPLPAPKPTPLPAPLPEPAPVKLKAPKGVEQPSQAEIEGLAKTLRSLALANMPNPLVKSNDGWGKQKEFVEGKLMLRNAKKFAPEVPRVKVNDGLWRRITVTARNPNETLGVAISELVKVDQDTANLVLDTVMDIDFRVEHQFWVRDRQLYSGETRGHCKAGLKFKAEVTTKTTKVPGSFFPEVKVSIKATEANLFYDKVVIDHTAGLDGLDAQKAGDFVIDLVKKIKPDLEQQLLAKANAAIVKAASAKDIKVPLDKLLAAPAAPKK